MNVNMTTMIMMVMMVMGSGIGVCSQVLPAAIMNAETKRNCDVRKWKNKCVAEPHPMNPNIIPIIIIPLPYTHQPTS